MKTMIVILCNFAAALLTVLSGCSVNASGTVNIGTTNSTYTVTYNANGAGGEVPADNSNYTLGSTVIVKDQGGMTKPGYALAGWTTSTNSRGVSYAKGAYLIIGSYNVTLYAVWITNSIDYTSSGNSIIIYSAGVNSGVLNIAYGVTGLDNQAFYGCSLTSVTIPPSVTSIGGEAFYHCTGITSITIPSGVTNFGLYTFTGCTSLTNVTINASTPPALPSGSESFDSCSTTPPLLIHVPTIAILSEYSNASGICAGWSSYLNILVTP